MADLYSECIQAVYEAIESGKQLLEPEEFQMFAVQIAEHCEYLANGDDEDDLAFLASDDADDED